MFSRNSIISGAYQFPVLQLARLGSKSKCQSRIGAQESSLALIKTTFYATIDERYSLSRIRRTNDLAFRKGFWQDYFLGKKISKDALL